MQTLIQDSAQRRPDGSIDIEHYVATAHRARAEEARALRGALLAAWRERVRRLGLELGRRDTLRYDSNGAPLPARGDL